MKSFKLILTLFLVSCIAMPSAVKAEKLKSKNNGFEYMVSKRMPVKFKEDVDLTNLAITSLAFNLKIYISYPYVINNSMNIALFDEKFTPAKYNKRNIDYFGRSMLLEIQSPELDSYMQYMAYCNKTSSMFLLVINEYGNVENIVVVSDDVPQPVSEQIKAYLKNSSWTPAVIDDKESQNVKSVYFIVADFGELPNLKTAQ